MPVTLPHHDRTTPSQLCIHPRSVHTSPIARLSLLSRGCQRQPGQVICESPSNPSSPYSSRNKIFLSLSLSLSLLYEKESETENLKSSKSLLETYRTTTFPFFLLPLFDSNADAGGYAIEEQGNKVDPSIERIFRGSSGNVEQQRRNYNSANSKRNVEAVSDKTTIRTEDTRKRPRIKRGGAEEEAAAAVARRSGEEKRAAGGRAKAAPSANARIGRSSPARGMDPLLAPKNLPVKDYEVPLLDPDEGGEEESVAGVVGARGKEARYRGEYSGGGGEDSARFIDQEERSSLYDDFEAKDVVKRGITGAEDYEEMEEEGVEGGVDEGAAFEEGSIEEEVGAEKRKYRGGDVRVKREHEASSSRGSSSSSSNNGNNKEGAMEGAEKMNGESGEAGATVEASEKTVDASLKRDASSEKEQAASKGESNQLSGQSKEGKESGQQSKRNVLDTKNENDGSSKSSGCDRDTDNAKNEKPLLSPMNDQKTVEMEGDEGAKLLQGGQEGQQEAAGGGGDAGGGKTQEMNLSSDSKPIGSLIGGDSLGVKGADASSKTEESKIADVAGPEALKGGDVPANVPETAAVENANEKSESSQKGGEGGGSAEQVDEDYQKRVEEQIQRKIDSIKEEIKREITENQRIREIEENNAKFEELRDEEEEEEDEEEDDQENESAIDKRDTVSKRSPDPAAAAPADKDKSQVREEKRLGMVRRKKRQGESGGGGNSNSNSNNQEKQDESSSGKKSRQAATMKKRSAAKLEAQDPEKIPRKRERPREVILVERPERKKKRRRRAKNAEQRGAKLEGNQPAEIVQDSSLRGNLGDGKVKGGN
ncbi:spore wall protein 2-like isoform X1 [Apis mellifera]|uniref:Spore wall protein 2-like isoform X1 n=1 Tax=Apis mellifera TaxID=7460 RepID=A0A7M7ILI0_APIME|nr:spore wall protein 2-like isoform X1 [Apis mellifera]|eukprot:XP_016773621.2 spore wall protein 2-like isoform X1 [Apis mellifera]